MAPDLKGLTLYLERLLRPPKHDVSKKEKHKNQCQIDGEDF